MKRIWTALILIALMIFFGISGESRTHASADMLAGKSAAVREFMDEYRNSAALTAETVKQMYDDWKTELDTLTLYMNSHNLRPITEALREAGDAAAGGDMERLDDALIKLSYAIDDMRSSEDLNIGNVF